MTLGVSVAPPRIHILLSESIDVYIVTDHTLILLLVRYQFVNMTVRSIHMLVNSAHS